MKLKETTLNKEIIDRLGGEEIEIAPKDVVNINGTNYVKIGLASKIIGKSTQTIKHWYEYAQEKKIPFPEIHTELDKRGTRYFREEDLSMLSSFSQNISYGSMSDYNIKLWGERGKSIKDKNSNRFKSDRSNKLSSNI